MYIFKDLCYFCCIKEKNDRSLWSVDTPNSNRVVIIEEESRFEESGKFCFGHVGFDAARIFHWKFRIKIMESSLSWSCIEGRLGIK